MDKIIKGFYDGSALIYSQGKFDNWCVYDVSKQGNRNPVKDVEYFSIIKKLAEKYSTRKIYNDFVSIYEWTGKDVNISILNKIVLIAGEYGDDALLVDKVFTILYMAMLAEENKAYTKLGKRIKRLGIYVLLFTDSSIEESANFMRGMNWRQIDEMCKKYGF